MRSIAEPKLYLDIDGVIITDDSLFERVPLNAIESYAPEVVNRLGSTGLKLAWLTTWGPEESLRLSEKVPAFKDGRSLELKPKPFARGIELKLTALIKDQISEPAPFVWVDDMITPRIEQQVSAQVRVPHLIVVPDCQFGLKDLDLRRIEAFAATHAA